MFSLKLGQCRAASTVHLSFYLQLLMAPPLQQLVLQTLILVLQVLVLLHLLLASWRLG
jgi:hypothetical protein